MLGPWVHLCIGQTAHFLLAVEVLVLMKCALYYVWEIVQHIYYLCLIFQLYRLIKLLLSLIDLNLSWEAEFIGHPHIHE